MLVENGGVRMSTNKVHDEHTRLISLKPQIIGLDGVVLSTEEINLRDDKGRVVSQPDNLLFDPSTQTVYSVEYKCHHTNSMYLHAKEQLRRSEYLLKNMFPDWNITKLYVCDDYKIEIIK